MDRKISIWAFNLALVLSACSHGEFPSSSTKIVRRLGGVAQTGHFVSPYSYEWFIRGELASARHDWATAVQAYRMALAAPEEDTLVLSRLADALDHLGEPDQAQEVLEHAAQLDISSEAVWLMRGNIAERHGDIDVAIRAYERAEVAAPLV